MADRAHSTSRRTLLAAPLVLPSIPAAAEAAPADVTLSATPPLGGACTELGRVAAMLIRRYQTLDVGLLDLDSAGQAAAETRMGELLAEIDATHESILRTRAISASDVLAKLLAAKVSVGRAKDDETDRESCEKAEDALRDCIVTMAELTGASLIDLGADWVDSLLLPREYRQHQPRPGGLLDGTLWRGGPRQLGGRGRDKRARRAERRLDRALRCARQPRRV